MRKKRYATSTYSFTEANPFIFEDRYGLARSYESLGKGYTGGVDTFNVSGRASFEIHVYDPSGNEVAVYGPQGWFNKHGKKGRPAEIPDVVDERCRSVSIDIGRRMGIVPSKGKANIKGDRWMNFFKSLGWLSAANYLSTNTVTEECPKISDPDLYENVCPL